MIKYINQDITKVERGVVAHGCNYVGYMGAGVALFLKTAHPKCFTEYQDYIMENARHKDDRHTLGGKTNIVEITEQLYIANCFTQGLHTFDGQLARTDWIYESLHNAVTFAIKKGLPLYMPKIGCGLGGLTWEGINGVEAVVIQLDSEHNNQLDINVCTWP